ncbi:FAD-dependent thymidylate synthase, partial [bacterium]|nr:FAD-dependent thymidylate synthase [bacterium]
KMPVFVARQWIRHRTARLNEISGRYSVMVDEFYNPEKEQVLYQSKSNRQGRDTEEVPEHLKEKVLDILISGQNTAYDDYQKLIDEGIARELSRINLPLSLYTQWYWQIDLSNLFHFLKLRMDCHAQWEIRQYAGIMADITKAVAPMAYEAFETHVLNSVSFSGQELEALKLQIEGKDHNLSGIHKAEYEAKIKNIQL